MKPAADTDELLEHSIRAASAVKTTTTFRQGVLRRVREVNAASVKRMRRVATMVLWLGIGMSVLSAFILYLILPLAVRSVFSLQIHSTSVLAVGTIAAFVVGLATWEWLDKRT